MVNYHQAKLAVNTVFLQGVRTAQDVTPLQLKHIYQAGEFTSPTSCPLTWPSSILFSRTHLPPSSFLIYHMTQVMMLIDRSLRVAISAGYVMPTFNRRSFNMCQSQCSPVIHVITDIQIDNLRFHQLRSLSNEGHTATSIDQ